MDSIPDIDALLERYLVLLDEYTTLRAELSRLQTATFHHLARANFAAERGVRFGQDYYDERMQAARRVAMVVVNDVEEGADKVTWEVVKATESQPEPESESDRPKSEKRTQEGREGNAAEKEDDEDDNDNDDKSREEKPNPKAKKPISKDPIRWFGLLTPLALRQTQASAIDTVERVIPRLVTVDAEMRQVEIEIRRARKRRAKAEAAAAKQQDLGQEATRAEIAAS